MNPRLLALGALAVFAVATGSVSVAQTTPAPAGPPTPPPPATVNSAATQAPVIVVPGTTPTPTATQINVATPTPIPTPTPPPARRGRGEKKKPAPEESPTDTPEPAQFQTMDGVWEIEGQPFGQRNAVYSHMTIIQKDQTLSGTWTVDPKHVYTIAGSFDGRVFKIVASDTAEKPAYTLQGYVENYSDMVGQIVASAPKVAPLNFTGQHRKKSKLAV